MTAKATRPALTPELQQAAQLHKRLQQAATTPSLLHCDKNTQTAPSTKQTSPCEQDHLHQEACTQGAGAAGYLLKPDPIADKLLPHSIDRPPGSPLRARALSLTQAIVAQKPLPLSEGPPAAAPCLLIRPCLP